MNRISGPRQGRRPPCLYRGDGAGTPQAQIADGASGWIRDEEARERAKRAEAARPSRWVRVGALLVSTELNRQGWRGRRLGRCSSDLRNLFGHDRNCRPGRSVDEGSAKSHQCPEVQADKQWQHHEDEMVGLPCRMESAAHQREEGVVHSATEAVDAEEAGPEAQQGGIWFEPQNQEEDRGKGDPSCQSKALTC